MIPASSKAIDSISPTRLERMRCPARVAFEQHAQGDSSSAASAAAVLGTIAHRAMEHVAQRTETDVAWRVACEEATFGGDGGPSELGGFRRTYFRYRRRANELAAFILEHPGYEPHCEVSLRSDDNVLRGQADLVLLGDEQLIVIDHKTGLVTEEDRPKAAYVRQVQIYAGLASETYDRPAAEAALFSLREGMVAIDVSVRAVAAAMSAARSELAAFNQRAPGPQPVRPSRDICRWCPFASRCDGFWSSVDESWTEAVGRCVRGTIERAEAAANGLGSIQVGATGERSRSVVVGCVPGQDLAGLPVGGDIALTGLRPHYRRPEILIWGPGSQVAVN